MRIDGQDVSQLFKKGHCDKHGDYMYMETHLLKIKVCPYCNQERIDAIEKERADKAEHIKAEYMGSVQHLSDMGIEPKFFNSTFDSFIPEKNEPFRTMQQTALDAVKQIVEKRKGFVILMGGHGTRKTTLSCAALKEFGEGFITNIYEASFLIRSGKLDGVLTGYSRLQFLSSVPMLVLDEIGRTNCSDYERNWISYVIDKRESRELPTILISNYPMKAIAPDGYRGFVLDDIFGTDVLSRLSTAKKIRVSGKDFRKEEYNK